MARFFTPPKPTGPASNKKAEPGKDNKQNAPAPGENAAQKAG